MDEDDLATGKIGKAHGLDGFVRITSFSGEIKHLFRLKSVYIKDIAKSGIYEVEEVRNYKENSVLAKFRGVDSPEEGSELTGGVLWVPREMASPLGKEEFYLADICKCSLVIKGSVIGRITAVCDGPLSDLLEVRDEHGRSHYVPFNREYIGKVDLEAGTIELLAEWILQ